MIAELQVEATIPPANFSSISTVPFSLSQQAFAKKMGTTQQRVSEWERGRIEPSLYNLMRILKVFSISFEELTDGIEEK